MIQFKNVSKIFGERYVLKDINLEVMPRELVSIIGPSGAGKTTLFNLLIGSATPSEGQIMVDDIVVNDLDTETLQLYRRNVGMIFQDYKLLPQKNVRENISFALEVCDTPNEEIEGKVDKLLKDMRLEQVQGSLPEALSGGEQQRVAIARALVHDPQVILADEPTGDLDPEQSQEIIDILKKIHSEDRTVIISSHDKSLINYLGGRVVKIKDGKIIGEKKGEYF